MPSRPAFSRGIKSAPLRPNNSMATAPLAGPSSNWENASAISRSSLSAVLSWPALSRTSTPRASKAAACSLPPRLASTAVLFSLARLVSNSATSTPDWPAAYSKAERPSTDTPTFWLALLTRSISSATDLSTANRPAMETPSPTAFSMLLKATAEARSPSIFSRALAKPAPVLSSAPMVIFISSFQPMISLPNLRFAPGAEPCRRPIWPPYARPRRAAGLGGGWPTCAGNRCM